MDSQRKSRRKGIKCGPIYSATNFFQMFAHPHKFLLVSIDVCFIQLSLLFLSTVLTAQLVSAQVLNRPDIRYNSSQFDQNEPFANLKDYTNHSVVKILQGNIHLLFDSKNSSHLENREHEILWLDSSHPNGSHAFVRLGPHITHRVKRNAPLMGNPVFLTDNLQSWIDSEQFHPSTRNSIHRPKLRPVREFVPDDDEPEVDNVGTLIRDAEAISSTVDEIHHSKIVPSFILNQYHPLSQVNKFMEEVEARSNGITVFAIGYSHEGRPIKAIEVLNNPTDPRFIWIDACTHAREWVTVTTAMYLTEQVITQKIPLNFIIVPVLNVDGYVYTWTKDRMWRKNRRPYATSRLAQHNMPDRCNGVDLNRNYDINFGGEGSSSNPCSFLYQGPFPFSEPEVKAASDLLSKNRHRIKMTLSLHSFNQLWSCPNAFTTATTADHHHHMHVLSAVQQAVLATNGVKYDAGPLGASLYLGSGFMMDWIYHKLGIRDAYLVELRDKGFYGFILPADQIWPTATETWAGLRAAIRQIFKV